MRGMLGGMRRVRAFRGEGGYVGSGCCWKDAYLYATARGRSIVRRLGSGRDFARAAGLAFSVAAATAAGANHGGFGDMKAAAGVDLDAGGGEFIPTAKLSQGYAKTIGNGDEGIAAAGGVVDSVRGRGSGRSDRHHESFHSIEFASLVQLIGSGEDETETL